MVGFAARVRSAAARAGARWRFGAAQRRLFFE
jgi:hypothetical protein